MKPSASHGLQMLRRLEYQHPLHNKVPDQQWQLETSMYNAQQTDSAVPIPNGKSHWGFFTWQNDSDVKLTSINHQGIPIKVTASYHKRIKGWAWKENKREKGIHWQLKVMVEKFKY